MLPVSISELKAYYEGQPNDRLTIKALKGFNQIILIRHGEPDLPFEKWSTRKKALEYTTRYDTVGVLPLTGRGLSLQDNPLKHVYSSPTPRALHTAQILFKDGTRIIEDFRFREFERKIFWFPNWNIFLPLKFWITFSRVLWLIGFNSKGIESRADAYRRAKNNALFLMRDAAQYGATALVAHGFHNKVLGDFLKKKGWTVVHKGGNAYGAINVFAYRLSKIDDNYTDHRLPTTDHRLPYHSSWNCGRKPAQHFIV